MSYGIILALALGFIIGYKKFFSAKVLKINGKLQTVWLILLIFSMGISIGSNDEIISDIPILGLKAFLFAVATVIGSVVIVYLFSKFLDNKEEEKE